MTSCIKRCTILAKLEWGSRGAASPCFMRMTDLQVPSWTGSTTPALDPRSFFFLLPRSHRVFWKVHHILAQCLHALLVRQYSPLVYCLTAGSGNLRASRCAGRPTSQLRLQPLGLKLLHCIRQFCPSSSGILI